MSNDEIKPGEWVILDSDDNIVFHNMDIRLVMNKAEDIGKDNLIISKEPSKNFCFY